MVLLDIFLVDAGFDVLPTLRPTFPSYILWNGYYSYLCVMETKYHSKSLAHLGMLSDMIDELGLVACIDKQLQIDGICREVSIGTICKALILNGN